MIDQYPKMVYGESVEEQLIVQDETEEEAAIAAGWQLAESLFAKQTETEGVKAPAKKATKAKEA